MYIYKPIPFQKVLYSHLKTKGFVPESGSEVFVKNIPKDVVDIHEFAKFFETAGEIFQIKLMVNRDELQNRGYGYVTYMDSSAAKRAQQLNHKPFRKNCTLLVEPSLNNCRIFLGGIPTSKTKNEVWQELVKQGVKDILDVIMYRSYSDRAQNRGFVFVEFKTHEQAALFRAKYVNRLVLFEKDVVIDWSIPIPKIDEAVMAEVTNIYLRNLDCCLAIHTFRKFLYTLIDPRKLQKVYRFKNFAFVHLYTRKDAEELFERLTSAFEGTIVEVHWAIPPNKYTSPAYRLHKLSSLSRNSRSRNNSDSTSFTLSPPPSRSGTRSSVSLPSPSASRYSPLELSNSQPSDTLLSTYMAHLDMDERLALKSSFFNDKKSCTCNEYMLTNLTQSTRSEADFLQNMTEESFSKFSSGLSPSVDSASSSYGVTSLQLDYAANYTESPFKQSASNAPPTMEDFLSYLSENLDSRRSQANISTSNASQPTSVGHSTLSNGTAASSRLSRINCGQLDLGWFPVTEESFYSNKYFSYK